MVGGGRLGGGEDPGRERRIGVVAVGIVLVFGLFFARLLDIAPQRIGPLIEELLEENHLLTAEHTLEHWPEELYLPGPMVDRTNWDQWQELGSPRWRDRNGSNRPSRATCQPVICCYWWICLDQ